MPLNEYEQKILEQYERELESDPTLVKRVSRSSLYTYTARRIRLAVTAFVTGLVMLMLFFVSVWVALGGFAIMLVSGLLVFHYLKRLSRDQIAGRGGRSSLASLMARVADRMRGKHHGESS
jgi:membrane protein implicated in regulation of membrane protease activity